VIQAALLPRFFGVFRPLEVRSLAAKQSGSLLGFGLFRSDRSKSSLPNFFSGFRSAFVPTHLLKNICMPFRHVFARCQAFKIFSSVVGFVAVNVVNLFARFKRIQPTSRYSTMHQTVPPHRGVSIFANDRGVGVKLSENFSAPRDGEKMVEKSVLDSVNCHAYHGRSNGVAMEYRLYHIFS
jgi:hypothetical protein